MHERAVKIGFAVDAKKRLRELQVGCPIALELLASAPGTFDDERAIQRLFRARLIRGEWYRLDETLTAFIRAFCAFEIASAPPKDDP